MVDVKNIQHFHVVKDCTRTANVQIRDKFNTTTYFGNGECVITDPQGNILTTTTALKSVPSILIHTRALKGDGIYTTEIKGSAIKDFICENYTVSNEQTSILGYNGTSGTIVANLVADTLYWVKVISKYNPGRRIVNTFSYKSGSTTPTVADIALGIVGQINTKGGIKGYDETLKIKASVLTDSTPTAITATGTVYTGSKLVTLSAATSTLVAGDCITIATVPYMVARVLSTTKIELNMPYQAVSATGVALAELSKAAGNWGIKIEGLPYEFVPGEWNYRMCKFELAVSEDITSVFTTTQAYRGVGTYKQVADIEWHTKNFFGNNYKVDPMGLRPIHYHYDAPLSVDGENETFDLITIRWEDVSAINFGHNVQEGSVTLAIPVGAGQADGGTNTIEEVLNKYIVTEYGVGTSIIVS